MPSVGPNKKGLYLGKCIGDLNHLSEIKQLGNNVNIIIKSSNKVFQDAETFDKQGDEERAYIMYLKYFNILKQVKSKADYKKQKEFFDQLIGRKNQLKAIERAEKLAESLKERYDFKEAEAVAKKLLPVSATETTDKSISAEEKAEIKAEEKLPEPASAPTGMISCNTLCQLLRDSNTQLILMDVRSATDFLQSHVSHTECISVPEEIISLGSTVNQLEPKLPSESKQVWQQRKNADHIILLDWKSKLENVVVRTPLKTLKDALFKFDTNTIIKSEPLVLEGGYEQWLLFYPTLTTNAHVAKPSDNAVTKPPSPTMTLDFDYPELDENLKKISPPPVSVSDDLKKDLVDNASSQPTPTSSVTSMPLIDRSLKPSVQRTPRGNVSSTSNSLRSQAVSNGGDTTNNVLEGKTSTQGSLYPSVAESFRMRNGFDKNVSAPSNGSSGKDNLAVDLSESIVRREAQEIELKKFQQSRDAALKEDRRRVEDAEQRLKDLESMKKKEEKDVADLMRMKRKLKEEVENERRRQEEDRQRLAGEEDERLQALQLAKREEEETKGRMQEVERLRSERKREEQEKERMKKQQEDMKKQEEAEEQALQLKREAEKLSLEKVKMERLRERRKKEEEEEEKQLLQLQIERERLNLEKVKLEREKERDQEKEKLKKQEDEVEKGVRVKRELEEKELEDKRKEAELQELEAKRKEADLRDLEAKRKEVELQELEAKKREAELQELEAKRKEAELRDLEAKRKEAEILEQKQKQEAIWAEERKRQEEEKEKKDAEERARRDLERMEALKREEERKKKEKEMVAKKEEEERMKRARVAEQSSKAVPASNLPTGWEKRLDRATNRYYYIDHNLGKTHWTLPAHVVKHDVPGTYKAKLKEEPNEPSSRGLSRSHSSPDIMKQLADEMRAQKAVPRVNRDVKPKPVLKKQPIYSMRKRDLNPVYGNVGPALTGLRNLGNSCYMNSTVQCLNNTSPLISYFLNDSYLYEINRDSSQGMHGEVVDDFAVVVKALWSGQYRSITPRDLKYTVGKYNPMFAGYQQQDSQEFLTFLLDGLHEGLNEVKKAPTIPEQNNDNLTSHEAASIAWKHHKMLHKSIIVELFQGQLRSTLMCRTCKKTSVTFQAFMFLSLPIPASSRCSLKDCLQEFLRPEMMTGSSRWKCPRCKVDRDSEKKIDIWKLPHILLVGLNRFYSEGMWMQKKTTYVDFPLSDLDLTSYISGPPPRNLYNLYGISNHYGTMEGGHYTAFCRNPVSTKWYKYDDHDVYEMSRSDVKSSAAFVLYYTSIEMPAPLYKPQL